MDQPDTASRKRRRVTPINFTPALPLDTIADEPTAPHTGSGTWDFLKKWATADDIVVDDIDEEEYYSDVSDVSPTAIEAADHESDEGDDLPADGPATRPSKLGPDKVIDIINDCIETYANAWTPGKGETKYKDRTGQAEVPVTYDALAMWEQAEASGQRKELAEKYELEAQYYRQRLDKLCEEVSKDPGDTIAGVQMASVRTYSLAQFTDSRWQKCRNLEVTVELLERAIWLEGIYTLPPEASSDNEEQDETAALADRTQILAAQFTRIPAHCIPLSQVVDLGSPSDSDISDHDGISPDHIARPSKEIRNVTKEEQTTPTRPSASQSAVITTTEYAEPASALSSPFSVHSRLPLGEAPENASMATVNRWSWAQLEETQDRKRIVSKAISELSSTERETMRQRLQQVGRASMVREIPACIDMLLRGDKRMPGILPQDLTKITRFTKLFLCWWMCDNYMQRDASDVDLRELKVCLQNQSSDPATFCNYVGTILNTTFSHAALSRPMQPSQAEIIEISDDDETPLPQPASRRRDSNKRPGSLETAITVD